jgi:hypothetical protein
MWEVSIHRDVLPWLTAIFRDRPELGDPIEDAIDQLAEQGPALGRPLVDRIHSSRHLHNLKELRPRVPGEAEIRLLFIFDYEREAIILVGGDKAGSWNKWYDTAIPLAERRYDEWVADKKREE